MRKTSWADYKFDARRTAFTLRTFLRMGFTAWRNRRGRAHPEGWQISLRALFERLGLTYLKLGQFLAMRLDLLPAPVRQELDKLFENVQPVPFEEIRLLVEAELKAPLGEVFRDFAPRPSAAASVAQVHAATTATGLRVAVKVQRPGVERIFASDVRLMRRMARLIDFFELAGTISLTEAVDQFASWTGRELDFIQEGQTADRMRASARAHEVIPMIHWALSTRRVLTMDYVEGLSIAEISAALERRDPKYIEDRLPGVSLTRAFRLLAQASMYQIFVEGFFHGDPHPGNMLVLPDGRVAFVDFGIFGELTVRQRQLLRSYLANLILGRAEESFRSYAQLFTFAADSNYRGFRDDIIRVEREWYALTADPTVPPEERLAGKFSDRIFAVVRQYRVRMNMDLLLFWRVFIVLDAVSARLSSGFDLLAELNRFFRDTDPGLVEENPVVWISRLREILESPATLNDAAAKLTMRFGSEWEMLVRTEENRTEEETHTRETIRMSFLLAGISLTIVLTFLIPGAGTVVVGVVLAAWAWRVYAHRKRAV